MPSMSFDRLPLDRFLGPFWASPRALLDLGVPPWRDDDQIRPLQREQEPKSAFVFTSERGSPFTAAGFARLVERAGATHIMPIPGMTPTGIFMEQKNPGSMCGTASEPG